ncbi:OsmC family protein [Leptolyngbya sp. AN02str]|uniref:OsmC family protein n=1 Tax=Leptolyngbya sp. AN02str TaxID=3423363 RepID=UPI003D31674A
MANHKTHQYHTQILWTGNLGQGTGSYKAYERSHQIIVEGKPPILGSSDPAFRGDHTKHNPEELFLASISACHMLWYLHLCAKVAIVVTHYLDQASGTMLETEDGSGHFAEVLLKPMVTIAPGSDTQQAEQLHEQAHQLCFIANSVNFPVLCKPTIHVAHSG